MTKGHSGLIKLQTCVRAHESSIFKAVGQLILKVIMTVAEVNGDVEIVLEVRVLGRRHMESSK